jgi:hypothetical protein
MQTRIETLKETKRPTIDFNKKVKEASELDFWITYLFIQETRLEDLERFALALALSKDYYKTYFSVGEATTELRAELDMSSNQYSRLKKELIKKGYLVKTGLTAYDTVIKPSLKAVQKAVKQQLINNGELNINFNIPLKITRHDN